MLSILPLSSLSQTCIAQSYSNNYYYCATDFNGMSSACINDDGAPMMYFQNGKWYLYGLLSSFQTCLKNSQVLFTKTSYILAWIVKFL